MSDKATASESDYSPEIQKTIDDLKAKYGEDNLCALQAAGQLLIFRRPTRIEYDRWFDKASSGDKNPSAAARELVQSALVYPTRTELISVLDKMPAVLQCQGGLLDSVTKLAGRGADQDDFVAKKL